jgi:hypothetical protein
MSQILSDDAMDEAARREIMGKTEDLLEAVEQYNIADEVKISERLRGAIAEVAKLARCLDLGEAPSDTMEAHSYIFEIQLKLMSENPRHIRARATEEEQEPRDDKTIRMKWRPRINPGGWQIIELPDDLDLVEDPELAAFVEALVERARHRYVYARFQYLETKHMLTYPDVYAARKKKTKKAGEAEEGALSVDEALVNLQTAAANYNKLEADTNRLIGRMSALLVAPSPETAIPMRALALPPPLRAAAKRARAANA